MPAVLVQPLHPKHSSQPQRCCLPESAVAHLLLLAIPPLLCSAAKKDGFAIHIYTATTSMGDSCLCNADGDFLIVPQLVSRRRRVGCQE